MWKNAISIFIGIALNLQIVFGSMIILTVLIWPVHEHGVSFHLRESSSVSFIIVLQFSKEFYSFMSHLPLFFLDYS